MAWTIRTSDEFDEWWSELDSRTRRSLAVVIGLLQQDGPMLPRPYADKLKGTKFDLRELRDSVYDDRNQEHVYRILYAFDPLRQAFICLGGDKSNDRRWYERNIRRAEHIFEEYLKSLETDEKENGNG